jgi:hypothetical protein
LLVAASVAPSSQILDTLIKEAQVPPKRRFLQEPHGVTTQKTPFFIVETTWEELNYRLDIGHDMNWSSN